MFIELCKQRFKESSLLKGSAAVVGATALDSLCRFGIVLVLVRYYTKEEFGIWTAITSLAAIILTGDFGITNALRNKISRLLVEEEDNSIESQKYFYSSFYFFLLLASVLGGLLLFFYPYLPLDLLLKTDDELLQHIGVSLILFVQLNFLFTIPFSIGNALYFTYQESHINAYFVATKAIFIFITVAALSFFKASILIISITYFLENTLFVLAGTIYFIIRHKWYNYKVKLINVYRCNVELIKVGIKFMTLQLSSSFLQNVGTILASSVLGITVAADYSMYTKLYMLGISVFQSVFNPLWGSYAAAIYKREFSWLSKTYNRNLFFISIIFGLFGVVMCVCGNVFLHIIGGVSYDTTPLMYVLLGISTLFFMLFNAATIVPKASNRINVLVLYCVVSCVVVIPFANVLLPYWGLYGLALITSLLWGGLFIVMHLQTKNMIYKYISK